VVKYILARPRIVRNIGVGIFLGFVILVAFFVGQAFANEPEHQTRWLGQKGEQYIIARPATTTTSTVVVSDTIVTVAEVAPRGQSRVVSESHELLMESAGIPSDEWWAVELLVAKESGWRVDAVNGGGCKGLGQNCGDWLEAACPDWPSNPVCQLRRFDEYVRGRYGNWPMAWAHSESKGWY